MSWIIRESGFDPERIAHHGNKFMIGNGVLGYRGTLEEFGKKELTATIVAGLYDQVEGKWREPVNAPNGLDTHVYWNGTRLSVFEAGNVAAGDKAVNSVNVGRELDHSRVELVSHEQSLDLRQAVHRRRSVFRTADGAEVAITAERFCSAARTELIVCRFTVESSRDGELTIVTGINGDVWDINGPHLVRMESDVDGAEGGAAWEVVSLSASTQELGLPITVAEAAEVASGGEHEVLRKDLSIRRRFHVHCRAGEPVVLEKTVAVAAGLEGETADEVRAAAIQWAREAGQLGYDQLLSEHAEYWERKWSASDILVEGDEEAQLALRYSMYQLHIIAPDRSEKVSIPARGLSGQVYKGAVFWDTEMFMLPFFLYTQPEVARNLMMYRVHTLAGAKRKAAEYGYEGAFYAWESQEAGDDACTLFNVNDVFTGRPMRTYFRDKQVHISADVAYGIWQVYGLPVMTVCC
ncbi:hypothetical protein [Paenibacillus barengoltzii]|uniref:hypothetical protein n=1 Tax=Paenibacillus barengoltzii TaxID=343517 RepID=UPI002FD9B754